MPNTNPPQALFSPKQFAKGRYPLRTVHDMIKDGRIQATRVGEKLWVILAAEVERHDAQGDLRRVPRPYSKKSKEVSK